MKTGVHPKYNETIKISCACGNIILAGSTVDEIKTELCSACHPFYTGKQKLVDTAGKVDKFMARIKKAQAFKELQVKTVESEEEAPAEAEVVEEAVEVKEAPKPILEMPTAEDVAEVAEEKPKKATAKKAAPKAKTAAEKAPKTAKKASKK